MANEIEVFAPWGSDPCQSVFFRIAAAINDALVASERTVHPIRVFKGRSLDHSTKVTAILPCMPSLTVQDDVRLQGGRIAAL